MNYLALPGGSTKGIQIAVATKEVLQTGFKPDIITTTSVSSIIILPMLLGLIDNVVEDCVKIKQSDIFKVSPVNKNNKISFQGWLKLIAGLIDGKKGDNYSFGIQDTKNLITKYINKETFNKYRTDKNTPEIYILVVNPTTKYWKFVRVKSLDYEEWILTTEASAHIPVMTNAIKIRDEYFVDGGNWAHNPEWIMLSFWDKIIKKQLPNKVIAIYPREEEFKTTPSNDWQDNVFNNLENGMGTYNIALSTCGQYNAKWFCKAHNIKHYQLFCPQIIKGQYETGEILEIAKQKTEIEIKNQITKFNEFA